jgi:CheY-like chemotaxis protein
MTKLCEGPLVLLAEDDDFNQEIATFQLESLGLRVDLAVNGVEAVEKAKTTHYDLIFMDMRMPVMDGLTATTRIRQLTQNASTPIIALTANAFSDDREKCLNAGMTYFITKPVEQKVLREAILQLLGHGHSVAPGR